MDVLRAALKEDTSTVAPTEDLPSVYTNRTQVVVYGALQIIIAILGLLGNLLVCAAVSLSKSLQDATHAFVVNLAISDFITALALPFQAVSVLSETGWPFGNWLCTLTGLVLHLSVPSSILTLTAIAVNRYIIITKSKALRQKIYTRRGVAVMVALMWLVPVVAVMTPQLIPATGGITYDPVFKVCRWDSDHPFLKVSQGVVSFIFIFCTIVIIFCYVAIFVYVWKHVRATRDNLRASSDNITNQETSSSAQNKMQIDITKNLAIVVAVFFICILPYSINLSVESYSPSLAYFALLVTLSMCLNPVIYAVKHPSFKAVFKCMFYCQFQEIHQPSEWLKKIIRRRNIANK